MRSAVALVAFVLASCGRTVVYEPRVPFSDFDAGVDAGVKPCITGVVPLTHTTPAIFFLIDRSGSMGSDLKGNTGPPFGNPLEGPTRWQILADTMSQVLPKHDIDLAMGAVIFPTNNFCGFVPHVDVTPKLNASGELLRLFDRMPGGGTPISAAEAGMLRPAMEAKAKSIVLITDGEPNCNEELDPRTCSCTQPLNMMGVCESAQSCLDDARSVATVASLFADAGVVTHVVGFATTPQAGVTLDQMAIAGGAPRMGTPKFHSAETQAELSEVLTGISERETNCTWTALTALGPDDVLVVRVGTDTVPPGGWEWLERERGTFVLRDTWCDRALAGESVTAVLTCVQP